jgi:site-specific DNA-methyltransferase (adenine-specific)
MAHWSENSNKLKINHSFLDRVDDLYNNINKESDVYLLRFPANRTDSDAVASANYIDKITEWLTGLKSNATLCILTSTPDAVRLETCLDKFFKFQLWIAIKNKTSAQGFTKESLGNSHSTLLVCTKYRGSLKHTKTRIAYTYCPACEKTTKDYGGKKHIYHKYGTLISDVWRDIEIDPSGTLNILIERLSDLFGINEYKSLEFIDFTRCEELLPHTPRIVHDQIPIFNYPKSKIEINSKLINGDCISELKNIPDNSVDFCFADPPYNLDKKYDSFSDSMEAIKYFAWCDEWLSELARILKPGCTMVVLNIPLWSIRHYQHLVTKLSFQSWIVWEALGFPVRMIMPSHYTLLCFSKGQPRKLPGLFRNNFSDIENESIHPLSESYCLRQSCIFTRKRKGIQDRSIVTNLWYDIHRLKHNSKRVDHPTQLPPMLMKRLYTLFTNPNEVVLDCFNGSGTSTLVAEQMGRRFIGIELSKKYHTLAKRRHEELRSGKDPFGKRDSIPQAKNSPVDRLPKQHYQVSKKILQLDVKRISQLIRKLPTREDVIRLSKYDISLYDNYFLSWGEVCAAARSTGMSELSSKKQKKNMHQIVAFEETI